MKTNTYENVKYLIEVDSGSECKLLSKIYINEKKNLLLECKCENEFYITLRNFKKGKHYCDECGDEIFRNKKELELNNYLQNNYNNEFLLASKYEKSNQKVLILHTNCNRYNEKTPDYIYKNSLTCNHCYKESPSKKRTSNNNFVKAFNNIYTNSSIELMGLYESTDIKINTHCNICDYTWEAFPLYLLKGKGCPKCNKDNFISPLKKTNEQFVNEMFNKYGDEYTVLGKYTLYNKPVKIRHNICGHEWNPIASNVYRTGSCPKCKSSKAEKAIEKYLMNRKTNYATQYQFSDCMGEKYPLRFDFAIFDKEYNLLCLIEADGQFHYQENPLIKDEFLRKENFKKVKERDEIKDNYCKNNLIKLIRIPYWDFKNIDEILNDKLLQIDENGNPIFTDTKDIVAEVETIVVE